jgi:hypothetical protein
MNTVTVSNPLVVRLVDNALLQSKAVQSALIDIDGTRHRSSVQSGALLTISN